MALQRLFQKDQSRRFIAFHSAEGSEDLALVVYSPPWTKPLAVDLDENPLAFDQWRLRLHTQESQRCALVIGAPCGCSPPRYWRVSAGLLRSSFSQSSARRRLTLNLPYFAAAHSKAKSMFIGPEHAVVPRENVQTKTGDAGAD